jgi:hypothetical protein
VFLDFFQRDKFTGDRKGVLLPTERFHDGDRSRDAPGGVPFTSLTPANIVLQRQSLHVSNT